MKYCWLLFPTLIFAAQDIDQQRRFEQGMRHLKEAAAHSENHRDREALAELEKAYGLLPPGYELTKLLGETYFKLRDPRAADFLEKAATLNASEEVCLLLGQTYWRQTEFRRALVWFERAVRANPQSAEAQFWTGYGNQLLGNSVAARGALEKALQLGTDQSLAKLAMGHLLAAEGKWEDAVVYLRQYSEQRPKDVEVRLKLGQIYLDRGLHAEARAELGKALELAADDKRVHYLLARVYTAANEAEQARQAFATFRKLEAEEQARKRGESSPYLKRD